MKNKSKKFSRAVKVKINKDKMTAHKLSIFSSFIKEYSRVMKCCIDFFWNYPNLTHYSKATREY